MLSSELQDSSTEKVVQSVQLKQLNQSLLKRRLLYLQSCPPTALSRGNKTGAEGGPRKGTPFGSGNSRLFQKKMAFWGFAGFRGRGNFMECGGNPMVRGASEELGYNSSDLIGQSWN
eukprot:scaffold319_cov97-Cylindrotheca_fusiformis.AAC.15